MSKMSETLGIGQDGKPTLCIGLVPGRKRPCLYFWSAVEIRVLASFNSDESAEAVKDFIEGMMGAKVVSK